MALTECNATRFWQTLGQELPRPREILMVSAHWDTPQPALSTATQPETIPDFYGFPEALYQLRYPAPGAPQLAERAAALIEQHNHNALLDYVQQAPHAKRNHPTDEHFLPLFVALGAAGANARITRELSGEADRAIALDSYVFA